MRTFEEAADEGLVMFLIDESNGIYVPQRFIECYDGDEWNISKDNQNELLSADSEYYWDVWDSVFNNAYYIDSEGNKWTLYQDGNLWAIREDANIDWDLIN